MTYLPEAPELFDPLPDDGEFWSHFAERRLMFQRCGSCGRHRHPPSPVCPYCQSTTTTWAEAPATGRLFSFTIVHHAAHDSVADSLPYTVALVEFPELDGVRFVSNIVDAGPEGLRIGMTLRLVWEACGSTGYLPRFEARTR